MSLSSAAASNGPSNSDRLAAVREVGDIDRRLDELRGQRKACVKRWKLVGISAKTLAVAKRDSGLDAEEIMEEIRERIRFNVLRGTLDLALYGKTGDFLDDLDTHVPEADRGEHEIWLSSDDGYRAGKAGVPVEDCPFIAGSERHATWTKAWIDGQTALGMSMAPGATMADASRARPERDAQALAELDAVVDADAEMTNVVPIDTAGGRLTPGVPSPKGGTTRKGGKAGKGKGKGSAKGGRKLQAANGDAPLPLPGVEAKRRPGRPAGSGNAPGAKATNGAGEHPEPLALSAPRKRGRPSKSEVAARAAVAEAAGRGDLVEAEAD